MDVLELDKIDGRFNKPLRCYAAKTLEEALKFAAKAYTDKGLTLPDKCYVVRKRWIVEIYLPVEDTNV